MITAGEILYHKGSDIISVDRDATVHDVLKLMVENKIGAVLVKENNDIVGVWTERDLVRNSLGDTVALGQTKIGDCLLSKMHPVPHTASLVELEDLFLGLYTRYLFVMRDETIIGVISHGDVLKAHLNIKTEEMEKLKSYVSMEYYENWRWDAPKKKPAGTNIFGKILKGKFPDCHG